MAPIVLARPARRRSGRVDRYGQTMDELGYLAALAAIASVILAIMAVSGVRARFGQLLYVAALVVLLAAFGLFLAAAWFGNSPVMLISLSGVPISAVVAYLGWRSRPARQKRENAPSESPRHAQPKKETGGTGH